MLKPVVVEAEGCSDETWWRDDNGQCWPPSPTDPGDGDPDPGSGEQDPWGGSGGSVDEPDGQPDPCSTGDPVIDSEGFEDGSDEIWQASNPDANLIHRKENGAWIVRENGMIRFESWTNVTLSFCGIDGDPPFPVSGEVIGFIHTHPYEKGETVLNCDGQIVDYDGTPSSDDRRMSEQFGRDLGRPGALPGYVIDKDQITRFEGMSVAQDAEHARCGY